jgi:hypothetical protein
MYAGVPTTVPSTVSASSPIEASRGPDPETCESSRSGRA